MIRPVLVRSDSGPAWRELGRLIAARPWLWGPNALSITLLSLSETVPGLVSQAFFDWLGTSNPSLGPVWWLLAWVGMASLAKLTFLFGCQLTNAPFMYGSSASIQHNLLRHVLGRPALTALPHSSGEALSRFRDDVDEAATFLIPFNDLLAWTIFAAVGMVIMLRISVSITLVVFVPLVLVTTLVNTARTRIEAYRRASRTATASVTGFLAVVFAASGAIQAAAAQERVVGRLDQLNQARLRTTVRDRVLDQVLQSVSRNVASIGTGAVLLVVAGSMRAGSFSVGDFALFVYYLGWIGEFTSQLGETLALYRQVTVSFSRLGELLPGAAPGTLAAPTHEHSAEDGVARDELRELTVDGLSYLYAGSGRGVQDVSLRLRRGECVIVTGRVGAGKTTLLRAMLGLLPPQAGTLHWNGETVADPAAWLTPPRCAYVPQVPRLFSASLRDNVLLGWPEDGEVALEPALAAAQLTADLEQLQAGLDAPVGPRGVALSGGQVQRTAVARALVRSPELLVLDDLSALDGPTEAALWQQLRAHGERTILAASHRRAALAHADWIVVLNDGRILDQGRLEDLLPRCAELQLLWHGTCNSEEAPHADAH